MNNAFPTANVVLFWGIDYLFLALTKKVPPKSGSKRGRRATHNVVLRPIKGFVGALFVRQLFEVGAQSAHPKLKSLGKRELKR